MASKIRPTRRCVSPVLIPLHGFDDSLLVRSDPETKYVDVAHAIELVIKDEKANCIMRRLLLEVDAGENGSGPNRRTGKKSKEVSAEDVTPEDVTSEDVTTEVAAEVPPEEITTEDVTAEEVTTEEVTPEEVLADGVDRDEVVSEKVNSDDVESKGAESDRLSLNSFTRVRWKRWKGNESIIAPLHVAVQCLLLLNSKRTRSIRSHAAKTTLRVAGGDTNLAAEVESNAMQLQGTETQKVFLADTTPGSTSSASNIAPTALVPTAQSAAVSQVASFSPASSPFHMLSLMPPGPDRDEMVRRHCEADLKAKEQEQSMAIVRYNEEKEMRMVRYNEEKEMRIVKHNAEMEGIYIDMRIKRQRAEREETEAAEATKSAMVARKRQQLESCNTEEERVVLADQLAMMQALPTEHSIALDREDQTTRSFTQAILDYGSGNANGMRMPSRFDCIKIADSKMVTLSEFMPVFYPRAKLSPSDYRELGAKVSKFTANQYQSTMRVTLYTDYEQRSSRAYRWQDLESPPLKSLITSFLSEKSCSNSRNPAPAGSMDRFVVQGVAVPSTGTERED